MFVLVSRCFISAKGRQIWRALHRKVKADAAQDAQLLPLGYAPVPYPKHHDHTKNKAHDLHCVAEDGERVERRKNSWHV